MVMSAGALLGASAIGALGSIGGAMASNAMSAYEQEQLARLQASLNYKYWKKQQLNQPSLSREGLEKANYNPMLALSNVGAGAGSSSWTSGSSYTAPDLSGIGNSAVSNALAVRQQDNQNMITEAQTNNYNADSVLKNNQAITELYSQLEKLNHADLMQAQKTLTDKNVSWYDKQQAREDLRVANEIERTGNDFKVGMAQAIASQISANAGVISANANSRDVEYRYKIGKEANKNASKANEIAEKNLPPKWASVVGGILGTSVGAGLGVYGAMKGGSKTPNFKTSIPYRR